MQGSSLGMPTNKSKKKKNKKQSKIFNVRQTNKTISAFRLTIPQGKLSPILVEEKINAELRHMSSKLDMFLLTEI